MSKISYLNGEFLPHEKCFIHIEDRGFQFADGAYEVTLFENQKMIDNDAHINRMLRSLRELNIDHNYTKEYLTNVQLELFARNKIESNATCYMQITRGVATRTPYCPKGLKTTISATVMPRKVVSEEEFAKGFSAMTAEDIRWKRCDIKTVNLLASTLVNQKAKDAGFDDAIFVREGFVTESTYANVFIVDEEESLITHPADNFILCGITRNRIIEIAKKKNIKVIERKFSVEEMVKSKEVFLSSSSLIIRPLAEIDGKKIGKNKAIKDFSMAKILRESYQNFIAEQA